MDGSFLEEKPSFKMSELTFSSKLDWGSYIISVAKTASKKIRALIHFKKVLSPEVQLAATLEPLAYCQSVASLSLFYRYCFGRCSSELARLVPLPYSGGRSTHYSDIFHDFISPFLDVKRMSISTVFFFLYSKTLAFSAYGMLSFDL